MRGFKAKALRRLARQVATGVWKEDPDAPIRYTADTDKGGNITHTKFAMVGGSFRPVQVINTIRRLDKYRRLYQDLKREHR